VLEPSKVGDERVVHNHDLGRAGIPAAGHDASLAGAVVRPVRNCSKTCRFVEEAGGAHDPASTLP
jgi:hypothetical protein